MTPRRARTLLAAFALVGGLVACGDDDSSSDGSGSGNEPADSSADESDSATTSESGAPTVEPGTTAPVDSVGDTTAGDDSDSTTQATFDPGFESFCGTVEAIRDFSNEVEAPDDSQSFEDQQATFVELVDGVTPLYEAALDEAPDNLTGDFEAILDYLETSKDAIARAESEAEAEEALGGDAQQTVVEAQQNVESFTEEHCGMGLTAGS